MIYLDIDNLIFSPLEDLWHIFNEFNASQIVAMAPNCLDDKCMYNKKSRVPYPGLYGINSGIILMNLTRMREFKFVEKALEYIDKFGHHFRAFDQEALNTMFHFHEGKTLCMNVNYRERNEFEMYFSVLFR